MVIVVLLLGLCLMFVAVMVGLNASVQDRLTQIQGQVGTNMTISPAGSFGPFASSGSTSTLTDAQVTQIENTPGVVKTVPTVTQLYSGTEIKSATTPTVDNGGGGGSGFGGGRGGGFRTGPIIYGADALADVSFFGGSTPTIASGRDLAASDANANVALMSQAMAQANSLSVGQTFTLQNTTLTLVGLYTTGTRFADNSVLLPVKTAERLFSLTGACCFRHRQAWTRRLCSMSSRPPEPVSSKTERRCVSFR
jgi:putative ABC transport system permease protein